MSSLDPRSLIAMAFFMALVMGMVLGFMRHHYPRSIRGLRYWAYMPLAWAGGAAMHLAPLGAWRDVPLLLANTGVLTGLGFFHLGCRHFFNQPPAERLVFGLGLLLQGVLAWFIWVTPSYAVRLGAITGAIAAMHGWTFVVLHRHGTRRFPVRLVQITLAAHTLVLLARLQTAWFHHSDDGLMQASTVQAFYLGAQVMAVLMLSLGAVLMATDRVHTEFEYLATHDGLTSALNRRAILALSQQEHERSLRQPRPFCLMLLDLDHFKAINDTHGHQHGDRVLAHFAHCMRAVLRRTDRLGRYGGEEFLVLMPQADTRAALALSERIHATLASGHALDCKVSIGLTDWQGPEDCVDAMLARADAALYRAKAQGRDQTCVG